MPEIVEKMTRIGNTAVHMVRSRQSARTRCWHQPPMMPLVDPAPDLCNQYNMP